VVYDQAMEDDQLLTKEGILGDEFGSAAHDIERCRENNGMARGLGEVEESLLQRGHCGADESDKRQRKTCGLIP
jgi:hypothetical protein